jgi:hypothetical protein
MDAISYTTELYGDVGGDGGPNFVRENRGSTVADWKRFSKVDNNETIFKNGLSLIEEVEKVIAGGAQARARIIKAYQDAGIDRFPDGRTLEEVIVE